MLRELVRILLAAFQDIWADIWTTLAVNLICLLAWLFIMPGPPATLALFYYANRLAHGEVVDLADFWHAFRRLWAPAWRWGALFLGGVAFLAMDYFLTGQFMQGLWKSYMQGLYLALLAAWLALQFFALPFLFEQQTMSVRQALRNAVALIGRNPGFTLGLIFLVTLVLIAGTLAFFLSLMLGAVFLACAGSRAVLNRLETFRLSSSSKAAG